MKEANYSNYGHYISDGWHKDPKRIFVFLGDHLEKDNLTKTNKILDVGCATGELASYLLHRFPQLKITGIDVFGPLVEQASELVPEATFYKFSALHLPGDFIGKFDVVTAVGVLDIFDLDEAKHFIQGMMKCCRPKGKVIILSPFNSYGMDLQARHRKRIDNQVNDWERGNNIYAFETIQELCGDNTSVKFFPFNIGMSLKKRMDPQRTWTIETEENKFQLINGLQLLMDLHLCQIEVP